MSFVIASQIALWLALLVLGVICIALARQIGVLHQRIAPAGALSLRQPLKLGEMTPEMSLNGLDGSTVRIGGIRGGRSQLVLFISPDCTVCETLLPAVRSAHGAERSWLDIVLASDGEPAAHREYVTAHRLTSFPYVLSQSLGLAYQVSRLPYAALIDAQGVLRARGIVNSREHLESLFEAKRLGFASIQDYFEAAAQNRAA